MVRVATRGLVDFTKAKLLDPKWWRYYFVVLDGMVRDDDLYLIDRQRQHHLAMISNGNLTDEGFERHQDRSVQRMYDMLALVRPWEETDEVNRKKAEYAQLKQLWEASFGKMDDPQTQKNIADEVARMQQRSDESSKYIDEEALVNERIAEYWDRQATEKDLRQRKGRRR